MKNSNKSQEYTRERCSYASKYKAIRKPTCGCRMCHEKWLFRI